MILTPRSSRPEKVLPQTRSSPSQVKVITLCLPLCLFLQLNFQRKVGVMYCRAGQSSEEDMYNNESSGPAFEEFLDLLGERVRLKGWEKYRAQLDNKSEWRTGRLSPWSRYPQGIRESEITAIWPRVI